MYPECVLVMVTGDDSSLPKEQMGQLRQVLISSFFRQVKEVCHCMT